MTEKKAVQALAIQTGYQISKEFVVSTLCESFCDKETGERYIRLLLNGKHEFILLIGIASRLGKNIYQAIKANKETEPKEQP